MKVHHIGYLVKRLETAKLVFESLGFTALGEAVYDELRDVDIQFMVAEGGYTVELVTPRSKSSVVANLIKTYKNAPYHICFESENLEDDIRRLTGQGFIQIGEPAPAKAINGRRVCFLMSAQIGMVEMVESAR